MSKKKKNIIDIPKVKAFLLEVYGITSFEVNEYHMKLCHEEYEGWFDWYHTTGTLVANNPNAGGGGSIGKIINDEDVAIAIIKHIK